MRAIFIAAILSVSLGAVCPARAQDPEPAQPQPPEEPSTGTTSPRPWQGLFGGSTPESTRMDPRSSQRLDVSGSVMAGYDQDLSGQQLPAEVADQYRLDQGFGAFSGAVTYTLPGTRASLSAFASAYQAYYPSASDDKWYDSQTAGATGGTGFDLSRRLRLLLSGGLLYSTDYRFGSPSATGGLPPPTNDTLYDYSLGRNPSLSYDGRVELERQFSSRSRLTASSGIRQRHYFDDDSRLSNSHETEAGVAYTRALTRYTSLRLGYRYRRYSFEDTEVASQTPDSSHDIDAGVDYARSLSFSRSTTLSFGTGSAITSSKRPEQGGDFDARFFFLGHANLVHQIGRSWTTYLKYQREMRYYNGYDGLALTDTASGGVGGLINRRTDFSTAVMYTSGDLGLTGSKNASWWTVSSQLRFAITQKLASYVSYYYYLSDTQQAQIPGFDVDRLERQGLRVGVTAWLPLIHPRGTR